MSQPFQLLRSLRSGQQRFPRLDCFSHLLGNRAIPPAPHQPLAKAWHVSWNRLQQKPSKESDGSMFRHCADTGGMPEACLHFLQSLP